LYRVTEHYPGPRELWTRLPGPLGALPKNLLRECSNGDSGATPRAPDRWSFVRPPAASECDCTRKRESPKSPPNCNCWNSVAVLFELRCSDFELGCSESAGHEHLVRDQGVGGSNPLSPTNIFNELQPHSFLR